MAQIAFGIYRLLQFYEYVILFYVLFSWIPSIRQSKLYYYVARIVEPYLHVFRRFIPAIGGLDFSPIVAILVLGMAMQGFASLYITLL